MQTRLSDSTGGRKGESTATHLGREVDDIEAEDGKEVLVEIIRRLGV